MSSGQIRSYISFIDDTSDDKYISRIESLIDELEDEKEKQLLKVEFTNKLNQIAIIRKYKTQYTPKPKEEYKEEIKEEKVEDTLENIVEDKKEKIEERLFLDEVYEDKLPIIKAPLYALMHIASSPYILTKGLPSNHDMIAKKYNIPKKPIYDEKAS